MEPVVDEGLARKFATEKDTPYTRWVAEEGLDIISGKQVEFEWQPGSLFAIPPQRLVPAQRPVRGGAGQADRVHQPPAGAQPVRRRGLHLQHATDFPHRFDGEQDYFAAKTGLKGLLLDTNFVPDALALRLVSAKERGAGGGHIRFSMAKGSMNSHISEIPVGTYKKAHRHSPGAHVIILSGSGFSLMCPEEEPRRYDWPAGSLIIPPNMWYYQHFNTGPDPARYLAFQHEGVSIRNAQGVAKAWISR